MSCVSTADNSHNYENLVAYHQARGRVFFLYDTVQNFV